MLYVRRFALVEATGVVYCSCFLHAALLALLWPSVDFDVCSLGCNHSVYFDLVLSLAMLRALPLILSSLTLTLSLSQSADFDLVLAYFSVSNVDDFDNLSRYFAASRALSWRC